MEKRKSKIERRDVQARVLGVLLNDLLGRHGPWQHWPWTSRAARKGLTVHLYRSNKMTEYTFEHNGIKIDILPSGKFTATVEGEELTAASLVSLKKKLDERKHFRDSPH